jgi:hypothetical protein
VLICTGSKKSFFWWYWPPVRLFLALQPYRMIFFCMQTNIRTAGKLLELEDSLVALDIFCKMLTGHLKFSINIWNNLTNQIRGIWMSLHVFQFYIWINSRRCNWMHQSLCCLWVSFSYRKYRANKMWYWWTQEGGRVTFFPPAPQPRMDSPMNWTQVQMAFIQIIWPLL